MRALDSKLVLAAVVAGFLGFAGCKDSPTTPGVQPEVVNVADHFSYQVTSMQGYTATVAYSWQNSGTQATINQSCAMTSGSATLIVLDPVGTQIYTKSLAENGTFTTGTGVPGTWTIRIVYQSTSATVNFRADVATP